MSVADNRRGLGSHRFSVKIAEHLPVQPGREPLALGLQLESATCRLSAG